MLSSFWNWYVIIITVLTILACFWILQWTKGISNRDVKQLQPPPGQRVIEFRQVLVPHVSGRTSALFFVPVGNTPGPPQQPETGKNGKNGNNNDIPVPETT